MRRSLVPVLLVILLLVSVSPVQAQHPGAPGYLVDVEVRHDESLVLPIKEVRRVDFQVVVRCASLGLDPGLEPHRIDYTLKTDRPWAVATLSKSSEHFALDSRDCLHGAQIVHHLHADVTFTKDTPAYDLTRFTFQALLDTGDGADATFTLRAGFYEHWQARFEQTIVKASPNEIVRVPLTIENHGNGAIQVRFRLHEQSSTGLAVALPAPQVVDSVIAGGETSRHTVNIDVRIPDQVGRQDQLLIIVDGVSAHDGNASLTPVSPAMILQTGDISDAPPNVGELPGAGALLLPILGALVALAARRRL